MMKLMLELCESSLNANDLHQIKGRVADFLTLPKSDSPAVTLVNSSTLDIMFFGERCQAQSDLLASAIEDQEFDPLASHGGAGAMRMMVVPKRPVSIVSIGPRYCVLEMKANTTVTPQYAQLARVKASLVGFLHVTPRQIMIQRHEHEFYLTIRDEGCAKSTLRLMAKIKQNVFNPLHAL